MNEPEKFEPDRSPAAVTDEGVIAPRVNVTAGAVEAFATDPETPFALTTDMVVTVPPPPAIAASVPPESVRPDPTVTPLPTPELLNPRSELAVLPDNMAGVMAPFAMVVAKEPDPAPVTLPVSVIVWSPVFVPVVVPLNDPEKFDPESRPEAVTDEGVIAPRDRVITGVVVGVATDPEIPFAEATETAVNEPVAVAVAVNEPAERLSPVPTVTSVPAPPDPYPRSLLAVPAASIAGVTTPAEIAVENEPVPEPVTCPVRVIVWLPVFVPEDVPEKFEPESRPVAVTELGVIAPNVMVIAGVVVGVAIDPETPFALTTEIAVTDPVAAFVAVRLPPERLNPVPTEMYSGTPTPAVDLPIRLLADMLASLASDTTPEAIVVVNDPVPLPLTSPTRAIV